ncbi:MAG: glycosyltransferase family 4 protein [Pyrinomonadaceae bacterium]|nr:glycosyltransferase family 4 protein [Pyrinomonadaceae bacterium]
MQKHKVLMRETKSQMPTTEKFSFAPVSRQSKPTARKKTRILMVGMHLTKTRGGITTLAAAILNSSLNEDFEFFYIASQAEDFNKIGKIRLGLRAIGQFVRHLIFTPPETIYVHLGSNASLYRESIFIVLAKIFRCRTIAHFHAGDIDNYYPFQSRAGKIFIRRALNLSDKLIAVSDESARQLGKLAGSSRVVVIPNAIDTAAFNGGNRLLRDETRSEIRLLFVGAIGKLKGERDLIRALAILRRRGGNPNLKVSFLGYGAETLQPLCEAAGIADWIEFTGAVSMDKRVEFFRQADIFVLPTYAEAMPMSVIEAMAAGLAVVTTNVGGVPELIENEVDGLLFAPGAVEDLADKISFLIENPNLRLAFGAKAEQKARERFDIAEYAEKLREHLRGCRNENE